jgi:hypothetical protein
MEQTGRTAPSYLIRNPHSYCFRMFVPRDLWAIVGRRELRYSLRTGYIGFAKHKARYLAVQVQMLFRSLRKGGFTLESLADDRIREMVNQYIRDRVAYINGPVYDEDYQKLIPAYESEGFDLLEIHRHQCEELKLQPQYLNLELLQGDDSTLEESILDLLKGHGIKDIDKDSAE